MKPINLKSLVNIYLSNNYNVPQEYQEFIGNDYKLKIKKGEIAPLVQLIENIDNIENIDSIDIHDDMNKYNNFYIGYKIPQIEKEFDLLRFDEKNVLNIEYKREIKDIEKIKKQLIRNRYYLSFLNKNSILVGYIQNINKLYLLENVELIEISFDKLLEILNNYVECTDTNIDIDNLFKSSNYLISPFNKTDEFIKNQYFLTNHQEEIKGEIMNNIENGEKRFLIKGGVGTGKTLLIYDLAKQLIENEKKVAIIHCGLLNDGQKKLKNNEYCWKIYPIKEYKKVINNNYDIIFIDEIQRIDKNQFVEIINYIEENGNILILSGDKKQTLKVTEGDILEDLENKVFYKYQLSQKIRTNKEISNFIKIMFDLKKLNELHPTNDNINIVYFNNYMEADKYISSKNNYSFISYTPTSYPEKGLAGFEITCENKNQVGTSHEVIGQEFENVGVIIDKHFYYDENKILQAWKMNNNVYPPKSMLYQAMTRVIHKLEIIVVENIELFNTLISLFNDKNPKVKS